MVTRRTDVDRAELLAYAKQEGADPGDIGELFRQADRY